MKFFFLHFGWFLTSIWQTFDKNKKLSPQAACRNKTEKKIYCIFFSQKFKFYTNKAAIFQSWFDFLQKLRVCCHSLSTKSKSFHSRILTVLVKYLFLTFLDKWHQKIVNSIDQEIDWNGDGQLDRSKVKSLRIYIYWFFWISYLSKLISPEKLELIWS